MNNSTSPQDPLRDQINIQPHEIYTESSSSNWLDDMQNTDPDDYIPYTS